MGNGEAKELICTTRGHELKGGERWWEWGFSEEGNKVEKKWDNCKSIINKIFFRMNLKIFNTK